MEGADNLISVGRIARPHGIRGEVKVTPLTDWPEKYEEFRSVYLELEDNIIDTLKDFKYLKGHERNDLVRFVKSFYKLYSKDEIMNILMEPCNK